MEKLLFESDGKNISENKKKIGRKLGVIFLIAGGIGFLLFGNMYSNFYGENRVYLQVLKMCIRDRNTLQELRNLYPDELPENITSLPEALSLINAATQKRFVIIIDEWDLSLIHI